MQTLWLFNNSLEAAKDVSFSVQVKHTGWLHISLLRHWKQLSQTKQLHTSQFIPLRTGVLAWTTLCAATARLHMVYKLAQLKQI